MTLSLDDVRNKRFRMARKSGYEVLEVDEFVDEVEATFEQLFQENQNLKKQVESLKSTSSAPQAEAPAPTSPASTGPATSAPAKAEQAPAPAAVPEVPAERIVVTTSKEASSAVVRLVELSTQQSEQLVAEATAEAARIREQASAAAQQLEAEARSTSERVQAEAQGRSEALDRDLATRRTQLFGELETQRDALSSTVKALRTFEATYRSNLTRHLQSQIEVLASGSEEPADPPAALSETAVRPSGAAPASATAATIPGGTTTSAETRPASGGATTEGGSDTPRLDALLGDQR